MFHAIELGGFDVPGYDSGQDVVADFGAGDRVDPRGHFEATSFAELKAEASQFGEDTVLRLGDDTSRIEDLTPHELSASMFLL